MVVRMRKWLPWPIVASRKFQVYITVRMLEGIPLCSPSENEVGDGLMVDVKWKGPKGTFFRRRSLKRLRTSEKQSTVDGIVSWDEKSDCECEFTQAKNNSKFQPWDVHFVILKATHQGGRTKLSVIGTAVMDIANVICGCEAMEKSTRITISGSSGGDSDAALVVTVSFMELWSTTQDGGDMTCSRPSLPCISGPFIDDQELVAGGSHRPSKNAKRPAEGKVSQELYVSDRSKLSSQSETSSYDTGTSFDSDSVDDNDDGRLEDGEDSSFRKSFSYGSLAGANRVHEGALSSFREGESFLEPVLSSHSRVLADMRSSTNEEVVSLDQGQAVVQQNIFSRLPWKKRKIFGSPRERGEPLLNKSYGDDGGDDIDHYRRQSCSSPVEQLAILGFTDGNVLETNVSGCLDFGDEMFSVGSWQTKEFVSRDGHMKLAANVFFASIDQRNEKAAGESACAVLVAVIANWLHRNPNQMPNKAEFDSLIREGSAEWRRLCENETYRSRFPDGHFDLDTVLEAKVRQLRVAPERSFVGFFQPEGMADMCDFLEGAMLFDNIWDAIIEETNISQAKSGHDLAIFIVSWNDHFFILKVDADAFYIVDTLGERLYEGCDQAYIIRFDKDARLCHVPKEQIEGGDSLKGHGGSLASPCGSVDAVVASSSSPQGNAGSKELCVSECVDEEASSKDFASQSDGVPVLEGKEACKCFLKEFFAAVPLRELQVDMKKGLLGKLPLHQRLQIEFHYMSLDV